MSEPPSGPGRTFGWKKTLAYSLLPVAVLLAGLELTARVAEIWVPPLPVDFGWGFDESSRLYVPAPDRPNTLVTNPSKTVNFHDQAFTLPKTRGCFRIFAMGGSSVNFLSYADHFNRLTLELGAAHPEYVFEIINCGGASYGSHRLVPIAREILAYEPDLVLLYTGHNEFEEYQQLQFVDLQTLGLQEALYRSAFMRFLRDWVARRQMARLRTHNQELLSQPDPMQWPAVSEFYPLTAGGMRQRMAEFRDNLSRMTALFQERRVPVVIGSVPSNLFEAGKRGEKWAAWDPVLQRYAEGKYGEGLKLGRELLRNYPLRRQSSDAENEIIRSVADQFRIPLADVEAAVIAAEPHHVPGETLFGDLCHLNTDGNRILINVFKQEILRLLADRTF